MPYQHDPAPPIYEYTLVERPRLAGTRYVLATPDGTPITKKIKRQPIPGYTSDPKVNTHTVPVVSVDVLSREGDQTALKRIESALKGIDYPATVKATIRGEEYTWHVSKDDVERKRAT